MEITDDLIYKMAKLSKLYVSEQEVPRLKSDFQKIVNLADKIQELDLSDISVVENQAELKSLRPDFVWGEVSNSDAIKNSKLKENGYFAVPKFLD